MKLSQEQNLTLDQYPACRQLVDHWQEFRYHKRQMNYHLREIRHICSDYGVNLRKPIVFALMLLALPLNAVESPRGAQVFAVTRSVRLEWDASSWTNVNYRVYYTKSLDYGLTWVDSGTNLTATVSGLARRTRYRFRATAIDRNGNETPPSNEVRYTTPK